VTRDEENTHLYNIDPSSPTFRSVVALAREWRDQAVAAVCVKGLDLPQTEGWRAQIAVCDKIIGLDKARASLPERPVLTP
jgi:hypothetical protein